MDYSKLTPLLIEAVNALRTEKDEQIAQRDTEIAELQRRLSQMEAVIEKLAVQ